MAVEFALDGNEHRRQMNHPGGPAADPVVLARLTELLAREWDSDSVVQNGLCGDGDFYREQAVIVAGMVDAGARSTEVQRYLRQLEQQVASPTLHAMEARHAIAVAACEAARSV